MSDDAFELLLELQGVDARADQLRHQIEHHELASEITQLHDRSIALGASIAGDRQSLERLAERQAAIESDIAAATQRLGEIDARLSGEASGSFRDQAAMSHEMESLASHRRAREDEELEVMEQMEPLERRVAEVATEQEALRTRAIALNERLQSERRELGAALESIVAARSGIVAQLPDALAADYERLRAKLGGVGAARLVHGMCEGCHLQLSATALDHVRHRTGAEVLHCEQCGRILVP